MIMLHSDSWEKLENLVPLKVKNLICSGNGQMTVEFVIAFPIMLIIAIISLNALLFLSECAAFDRLARQAICTYASAPAYGGGSAQVSGDIQQDLQESFDKDYLEVSVEPSVSGTCSVYVAKLRFTPTLLGRNFSGKVFGVRLQPLTHSVSLAVDPYHPGAIV